MSYAQLKEIARQCAINWQLTSSNKNMSYAELKSASDYFYKLGKRYGLIKEFKMEGIL